MEKIILTMIIVLAVFIVGSISFLIWHDANYKCVRSSPCVYYVQVGDIWVPMDGECCDEYVKR